MQNELDRQAAACAARVSPDTGFDPISLITIITALIPLLTSCFKQTAATATPREYLEDHFDEDTGTFDQSLINRCRPQTRRAARKEGNRRLSRSQLDDISAATLLQAKDEDQSIIASCMAVPVSSAE